MYNACDLTPTTTGPRQPPLRVRRNDMQKYMLEYMREMPVFFSSMCRPALHAGLTQCLNLGLKQFVWAKIGKFRRNEGLLKKDF